jgi:hypothetical protein
MAILFSVSTTETKAQRGRECHQNVGEMQDVVKMLMEQGNLSPSASIGVHLRL